MPVRTLPYLTYDAWKEITIMPAEAWTGLPPDKLARFAAFMAKQALMWSQEIDDLLRKRYAVPFDPSDPPATVVRWMSKLLTREAYSWRGFNPTSPMDADAINGAAERVEAQLKEAADSEKGLFELPLRESTNNASGVSKPRPRSYSEQSPYVAFDLQSQQAAYEDERGGGTRR